MVRIRIATEKDVEAIVGFQLRMARESENMELDLETLQKGVSSVFLDPSKGKYFVAVDDEQVVASLMITLEWSDWRNQWVYWIQSVFVEPKYRKKGTFRMMYEHLKKLAKKDESLAGLRLYVDLDNKNAAEVYKAIGMDGDHYRVFEWMKD